MDNDSPILANRRYDQFFDDVAETKVIWLLKKGDGFANWTNEGDIIFPVWSRESSAARMTQKTFSGYEISEITVSDFLRDTLSILRERGFRMGINLTEQMTGIDIPCSEFAEKLNYLLT